MRIKIDRLAAYVIVLLGTIHTALTPVLAPGFRLDPPDFAAIGLAFIFLGFLNVIRLKIYEKATHIICLVANILGIAWLSYSFIYNRSFAAQGALPFFVLCYLLMQSLSGVINFKKFN